MMYIKLQDQINDRLQYCNTIDSDLEFAITDIL